MTAFTEKLAQFKPKPHHRPLRQYRRISIASSVFLLVACVLLLLVGLSMPIIKAVYIIRVYASGDRPPSSLATELRFGVWGLCALSTLDEDTWYTNSGDCFGPRLGYTIPSSITSLIGLSDTLISSALTALLAALIIHLVSALLALLTFLLSLFLASHAVSILALFVAVVASLLTTLMFAIDVAVVRVVADLLPDYTGGGFVVGYGNAVWMALGAMVCGWVAVGLLSARACYCCGVRRKPPLKDDEHYHHHPHSHPNEHNRY